MTRHRTAGSLLLGLVLAAPAALAEGDDDLLLDDAIANCVVEPNVTVELSSRIDGILEEVNVQRGDWVKAGLVVARLEDGVERAAMEQAHARAGMEAEIHSNAASFRYGESTLKRMVELQEKRVVSADEVERTRSEAEIARHRLQQARDNKRLAEFEAKRTAEVLKRHTITSPIDGVVAERYLNPGESVEEKPILRIAQLDPLRVELVVPAARYGTITPGDRAEVQLESMDAGLHEATVVIVDPLIDAASGTFRVTLELPNPEHRLTSGLRCAVSFVEPDPFDAEESVADAVETPAETAAEAPADEESPAEPPSMAATN